MLIALPLGVGQRIGDREMKHAILPQGRNDALAHVRMELDRLGYKFINDYSRPNSDIHVYSGKSVVMLQIFYRIGNGRNVVEGFDLYTPITKEITVSETLAALREYTAQA